MSSYALDDSTPAIFNHSAPPATTYHNLFYASPTLQLGEHSLVITFIGNNSELWLDYLQYEVPGPQVSTRLLV